jgi:hypothetical protein
MTTPTEKELQNSIKVLELLSKIDGIAYEQQETRPDIFVISEPDTNLTAIVDVEEDVVVTFIEITSLSDGFPSGLAEKLLEINHGAAAGAYTVSNDKLFFKSNLAIENLDLNELEDSIRSVFYTVHTSIETISTYFSGE